MRQFTIGFYKNGSAFPDKTEVIFKDSYIEAETFVQAKNKRLKNSYWTIDSIN